MNSKIYATTNWTFNYDYFIKEITLSIKSYIDNESESLKGFYYWKTLKNEDEVFKRIKEHFENYKNEYDEQFEEVVNYATDQNKFIYLATVYDSIQNIGDWTPWEYDFSDNRDCPYSFLVDNCFIQLSEIQDDILGSFYNLYNNWSDNVGNKENLINKIKKWWLEIYFSPTTKVGIKRFDRERQRLFEEEE